MDRTKEKIDPYWTFPNTNYSKVYNLADGGTIGLVFIDTTTLAPNSNKCCNENGGISNVTMKNRIDNQLYNIEKNFIRMSRLENLKWLIVFGHYPIYSKGEHGDNAELIEVLEPLFHKYKVTAYFCGHDHITEHLSYDGIQYFVTGAGMID